MRGSKRYGSKRYSVSKNEELWVQHQVTDKTQNENISSCAVKTQVQQWLTYLPVLEVFILSATLVVSYLIGRLNHNIKSWPYVPFASEIGSEKPQSCVYTLGISTSAFFTCLVVLLRYKQVSLLYNGFSNSLSLFAGITAALSKLVVASFQYDSIGLIHYIAVGSYFFCSFIFCSIQVYLTRRTITISSKALYLTRLILAELIFVMGVILGVFFFPHLSYMNKAPKNVGQITHWLLLTFINIYSLTFVKDLQKIKFAFDVWTSPEYKGADFKALMLIPSNDSTTEFFERESTRSQQSYSWKSTCSSKLDSSNDWNDDNKMLIK